MVLILEKFQKNFGNDRDSNVVNLEMGQNSKSLKRYFFLMRGGKMIGNRQG